MQFKFPALLIGMPGGLEWVMIIIASLLTILVPVVLIVYFIKKYLGNKKEKQVIRKL